MVKNDICLGGASKQNALFSENVPPKNAPIPPMSRIGPAITESELLHGLKCRMINHQKMMASQNNFWEEIKLFGNK